MNKGRLTTKAIYVLEGRSIEILERPDPADGGGSPVQGVPLWCAVGLLYPNNFPTGEITAISGFCGVKRV